MKIKAILNGVEQEFEVKVDGHGATHMLTEWGILTSEEWEDGDTHVSGIKLCLIRPHHTFGRVEFEEIETRKQINFDEWYRDTDGGGIKHYIESKSKVSHGTSGFIIFRPVAIEEA